RYHSTHRHPPGDQSPRGRGGREVESRRDVALEPKCSVAIDHCRAERTPDRDNHVRLFIWSIRPCCTNELPLSPGCTPMDLTPVRWTHFLPRRLWERTDRRGTWPRPVTR